MFDEIGWSGHFGCHVGVQASTYGAATDVVVERGNKESIAFGHVHFQSVFGILVSRASTVVDWSIIW